MEKKRKFSKLAKLNTDNGEINQIRRAELSNQPHRIFSDQSEKESQASNSRFRARATSALPELEQQTLQHHCQLPCHDYHSAQYKFKHNNLHEFKQEH